MRADSQDVTWMDGRSTIVEPELARLCRLTVDEVEELVEYGLLSPVGGEPSTRIFSAAWVEPLRQAGALRGRFDLDVFVMGLMAGQFQRIASLEQQLRTLQAHLPHANPAREGPTPWHEPHG